jgi:glucose-6-phosphate isomerase, archaeal
VVDDRPYTFDVSQPDGVPNRCDVHILRTLKSMRGQYLDQPAYAAKLAKEDTLLYEVFELSRPEVAGELIHGISIVHPGLVGKEYFMTKGHFHNVIDTAEIYHVLQGQGKMVLETLEGNWAVEDLTVGKVLYVPPKWAHRSVNTQLDQDLITFFAYPGNAGHDYGTIEAQGFRKLVVRENGQPVVIDNPRWRDPAGRNP